MKSLCRIVSLLAAAVILALQPGAALASLTVTTSQRLATRTGPGTKYDEPGSFLSAGASVTAVSRAWDSYNEIWWVQVDFYADSSRYRVYTGLKRLNVNVGSLPEDRSLGTGSVLYASPAWYGPGPGYKACSLNVPSGVRVTVWGQENGYSMVEFSDSRISNPLRRCWIETSAIQSQGGGAPVTGYGLPLSYAAASSYIRGSDPARYVPDRLIDGDSTTNWQFSAKSDPLGSAWAAVWLAGVSTVSSIQIRSGYWGDGSMTGYFRNGRPRLVAVGFRYSYSSDFTDEVFITLADHTSSLYWQTFSLGVHYSVAAVRLRILSAYEGTKYPDDIVISDVALFN